MKTYFFVQFCLMLQDFYGLTRTDSKSKNGVTESGDQSKSESVHQTKPETGSQSKPEAVNQTKPESVNQTKSELATKPKSESVNPTKPESPERNTNGASEVAGNCCRFLT